MVFRKRIRLVDMSHVIEMIVFISPIDSAIFVPIYINKVVDPHEHGIKLFFWSFFYLTIFCVNYYVTDDPPSQLYIVSCSIQFMFIIMLHWENCLHFVYAPRFVSFFTHPTTLMHLKKWILRKCIQLHFIFLAPTRMLSHWELL